MVGNSLRSAVDLSYHQMNTKLYVGNLSFDATENEIQDMFATCGPVTDVNLIVDRMTNRSRGFAFVTMETPEGAQSAIQQLAGKEVNGRALTVNEARPREAGGGGGGGRGFGGGGERRGFGGERRDRGYSRH